MEDCGHNLRVAVLYKLHEARVAEEMRARLHKWSPRGMLLQPEASQGNYPSNSGMIGLCITIVYDGVG